MSCHDFELELGDYVDQTLAPDRLRAIDAHVNACARCRAIVTDFTAIRGAARTLEPQMPAAHVWTQLAVLAISILFFNIYIGYRLDLFAFLFILVVMYAAVRVWVDLMRALRILKW